MEKPSKQQLTVWGAVAVILFGANSTAIYTAYQVFLEPMVRETCYEEAVHVTDSVAKRKIDSLFLEKDDDL